jgi:DNA mismatch repair protein MutS2
VRPSLVHARDPATGDVPVLVRWLAAGRGDALRHLGWTKLLAAVIEHLSTDMARARVRADLEALDLLGSAGGSAGGLDHARISPNVRAALERLPALRPESEIEAAQARLDELLGIEALILHGEPGGPELAAALGRLEDLGDSLTAVSGGALLSVVELIGVAELCRACACLAKAFAETAKQALDEGWTRGLAACATRLLSSAGFPEDASSERGERPIEQCPSLLALLDRSIDRTGEEPQISSKASPALAEARSRLRACKQGLQAKAERLLRTQTIADSLRDRYWTERDGRIVLPVRSDRLGAVRSGGAIIHGSSASGHTFFVEPGELVEDNNALREAELTAAEEERKILRQLTAAVAEQIRTLRGMQEACVELDLMLARLRFGESLGPSSSRGARIPARFDELPPPSDEGGTTRIDLRGARHPLMLLDGVDVVPNDILLERGHALIISGPNAGGKTVALKTLGVFSLMAASGFALPCEGRPRIPLFTHIVTDIGDDQSINANLSTFSAHIGHVGEALRAAAEQGPSTLVLLDEVAVGTDPEQGAALAEAILVGLVEAGATVVATTHYDRLKLLATAPPTMQRFHNAAVGFDLAHMRPTFRLSLGVPGSSSAIAVARRLGLPESVLVRAEQLLGDEGVKIDELLRDIEAERQSLARTRERLERDAMHLRERDSEVRARERRVLEGVRSRRAKAYAAAAEQLRELEIELKSKRKQLRQGHIGLAEGGQERTEVLPTRAAFTPARAALAQYRAEAEAEAAADIRREDRVDQAALAVGDRVRVLSMKQDGEIVALLGNPPKRATVQLPNVRTTVKLDDLLRPHPVPSTARHKRGKATPILDFRASIDAQTEAHFGASPVAVKVGIDNACDVRGHRYEDAQEQVERFVADALARDQDVIVIRHGHGGGALRKAVREVLGRISSVRAHRSGLVPEGGEGVTVAWLE